MMARLLLRFTEPLRRIEDGFEAAVDWLVRDQDGSIQAQGRASAKGLRELVETVAPWAADPDEVVVLIPVGEVLSVSCHVPGRSVGQMRRALPYAVEEFVVDDIDSMQVASAGLVRNQSVRCLVAPRASIEDWLACLSAAGIHPGILTADAMALADHEDVASVLFDGDTVLVRSAQGMVCVDPPNLTDVLRAIRSRIPGEQGADVGTPGLRVVNGPTLAWNATGFTTAEIEEIDIETTVLAHLATEFDPQGVVNLLQGDYAVRRRARGAWGHWRAVAAAAGIWFVAVLAILAAQGFWADYRASGFRDEAVSLYRTLFDVQRVAGNPAARMRRLLGQTPEAATGFHRLTSQLAVGLSAVDGRYELRGLNFSPRRGIDAVMVVPNDAVLEDLGGALRRQGMDMEVISTDSSEPGGRIGARLRVTPSA